MRGAVFALSLSCLPTAGAAQSQIMAAFLTAPTDRYQHDILGRPRIYGELRILYRICGGCAPGITVVTLPDTEVFEDVEARVVDLDGDGIREVLVVQTSVTQGASLAVYDAVGKVTATPYIGTAQRWLAPIGVGDFNDDGRTDIAYVDQPHLVNELVFLDYGNRTLTEFARLPGLTNHRKGALRLVGGVRNCGSGDEVVLASADWTKVMVARATGMAPTEIGPFRSSRDTVLALRCPAP